MTNLIALLGSVPFYGLWLGAIVVAVSRWNRHPTVSKIKMIWLRGNSFSLSG